LVAEVRQRCTALGDANGVSVETTVLVDQPPTPMAPTLLDAIESSIRHRGLSYRRMVSGAGHDSQILGRHVPTAMIFVPSRGGRSHSPAEHTPHEQLMPGVQTLADVLDRISNE
jgi:N-carbamoyl-L-amino-acid hydrolase